jgi:hypothetical protein
VKRRTFLLGIPCASCLLGDTGGATIRGKLGKAPDGRPALQMPDGRVVAVKGDASTMGVLNDKRLAGADFEASGKYAAPGEFTIDPIHTKSMFVHKDGKKLMITYWCDVCSIRTYTPGVCWCCQEYTQLDLREKEDQ